MLNLLIGNYNNYFNRIVKKEEMYTDVGNLPMARGYIMHMESVITIQNINFNPNDGIVTKVILGKGDYLLPDYNNHSSPDYAVLYETQGDPFNDGIVKSRWFVIEAVRTRGGQYELTLKRDVLVDYYDIVVNSPVFIEKARLRDDDPLIFNNEGMSFNQIKTSETPIKDETKCGWVVGYIPSDSFEEAKDVVKPVVIQQTPNITVSSLDSWQYYKNCTANPNYKYLSAATGDSKVSFKLKNNWQVRESERVYRSYWKTGWSYFTTDGGTLGRNLVNSGNFVAGSGNYPAAYTGFGGVTFTTSALQDINNSWLNKIVEPLINNNEFKTDISALLGAELEIGSTSGIIALRDKILKDNSTGLLYRISLTEIGTSSPIVVTTDTTAGSTLLNYMNSNMRRSVYIGASSGGISGSLASGEVKVELADTAYAVVLTPVTVQAGVQIDSNRAHLEDAPYDMFCIPFSDDIELFEGSSHYTCSKAVALGIATQIGNETGTGNIYDIQILPYCPCRELIAASTYPDSVLNITGINHDTIKECTVTYEEDPQTHEQVRVVTYGNKNLSAIIWCTKSTFQIEVNEGGVEFPVDPSQSSYVRAIDIKESNECDLYRLVSGNYNGIFEFSPAKSNGYTGYIIDCTYKPYQPYIHIIPKLKGLYGENFTTIDDSRGLICGGDFSLPQLSNNWANYQLNNKTYNDVFERQLQNIDVTNKIAKQEQAIRGVTGSITGGISGGMTGAMAGSKAGPYGAIIGAAIGGTVGTGAGIAGGVMDYQNLIALQQEGRNFTIDMYNYSLQNMQAIPSSLTRVSSLTFNTRIWPFVEYYTCTDREKEAFRNKLIYNGMTTMVIGYPYDYIDPNEKHFIKGQVIRFEQRYGGGLRDDSHVADEIYKELLKGVYL